MTRYKSEQVLKTHKVLKLCFLSFSSVALLSRHLHKLLNKKDLSPFDSRRVLLGPVPNHHPEHIPTHHPTYSLKPNNLYPLLYIKV